MSSQIAGREFGSFRDPSGCVVYLDGNVYRCVDKETHTRIHKLKEEEVLDELSRDGLLVKTDVVDPASTLGKRLAEHFAPTKHFLSHDKVPFVSYPYEWTVGMLADAGLLHLEIQLRLLKKGYSLKDASAFNVAFVGTRPVFMDVPSIEIPERRDIWRAYGQFCRMFVYPLLLNRYRGMNFRQCFMGDLSGPSVAETRRLLGSLCVLRPSCFVDVFLQDILCGTAERRMNKDGKVPFRQIASENSRAQELNLLRLRKKLKKLSERSLFLSSVWAGYEKTKSYGEVDELEKSRFVKDFLEQQKPTRVLDMGCNTGRYALLAAQSGSSVVAADADLESVGLLYSEVRGQKLDLLPLCMDISNPAPSLGFRHMERKSFEERADFDCVLALALVHHLLVSARIPLSALCEMFADLTSKWLIIEFVSPDDEMFRRLLATREDLYGDLTSERFESEFSCFFNIVKRQPIMNGKRILYLMQRRVKE